MKRGGEMKEGRKRKGEKERLRKGENEKKEKERRREGLLRVDRIIYPDVTPASYIIYRGLQMLAST